MYNVIASGSTGNCVIYHNSIMVDCGVPFSKVKPFISDIDIVLLTHKHKDHFNLATIKAIQQQKPSVRIGCCVWMDPLLKGVRNIDLYDIGLLYSYGQFEIIPVKLYHDVPNCGYRIFCNDTKIFHATDTAHLNGITAKDYDLYAIEHNYDDETIREKIEIIQDSGGYAYQKGAMNSHLSEQAARNFIFNNGGPNAKTLRLHESKH